MMPMAVLGDDLRFAPRERVGSGWALERRVIRGSAEFDSSLKSSPLSAREALDSRENARMRAHPLRAAPRRVGVAAYNGRSLTTR